ncbi:hypothetical protein LCGC14_1419280 [marine sediment metagenome]|uniref:Uncharacterized protein n=1 Tax=marine sediment metagenome TaxID=412755 RepID=A0A0F9MTJ1_9ZZZZ
MFDNKDFFIYAYLVLLRGMESNENKKRKLLARIHKKEQGGTQLIHDIDAFMNQYGLNFKYFI